MKINEVRKVIREMSDDMSEEDARARLGDLTAKLADIKSQGGKLNWRRHWMKRVEQDDDSVPGRYATGETAPGASGISGPVLKPNKPLQDMLDTIDRLSGEAKGVNSELSAINRIIRKFDSSAEKTRRSTLSQDERDSEDTEKKATKDKADLWARYGGDPDKNPRGLGS